MLLLSIIPFVTAMMGMAAGLLFSSVHEEVHITEGNPNPTGEQTISISVNNLYVGRVSLSQARAPAPLGPFRVQT